MAKLHLDSEYKNRYELFYLSDGTIEDSREKNWRDVEWDKVVKIAAIFRKSAFEVDNSGPNFKAFMNFRWVVMEAQYNEKRKFIGHKKTNIWTIGWTDGETCFQKNINFKTGLLIDERTSPIKQFAGHVHPAVHNLVFGGK